MKKNWKSKNDLKNRLRALNKELWAIYAFFVNLKFDNCQNTSVNQLKSKNHKELNFSHGKIQRM